MRNTMRTSSGNQDLAYREDLKHFNSKRIYQGQKEQRYQRKSKMDFRLSRTQPDHHRHTGRGKRQHQVLTEGRKALLWKLPGASTPWAAQQTIWRAVDILRKGRDLKINIRILIVVVASSNLIAGNKTTHPHHYILLCNKNPFYNDENQNKRVRNNIPQTIYHIEETARNWCFNFIKQHCLDIKCLLCTMSIDTRNAFRLVSYLDANG